MVHSLKEAETRETLRRCHANQQREALLPAAWTKPPANSYNVFLLFNLEAAWDLLLLPPQQPAGGAGHHGRP